ncbi:MAG: hypothetical protein AB1435_14480 [Chloroflexota bacterium]|jgi:hypothetical protein
MDFPLIDLLDPEEGETWLEEDCHPEGLRSPHCQASTDEARFFRVERGSGLPV